jgi:thioredoxin-dependent peroxiredoxin
MKSTPYPAPAFSLPDETGQIKTLNDYVGKWLILYFYPKDDTPGCTIQACSLRDARDDLVDLGAIVVGISKDNSDSHDRFKAKHMLNFSLLSDESGQAITAYDAWGKKMFGKEGILRKTFIIAPTGLVRKVYGRATPAGHGSRVVSDLRVLQEEA